MTNSIVQGAHKLIQYQILQQLNLMYAQYQNIIITKLKALFNEYVEQANHNGASLTQELYLDLEPVVTTGQNRLVELGFDIAKAIF